MQRLGRKSVRLSQEILTLPLAYFWSGDPANGPEGVPSQARLEACPRLPNGRAVGKQGHVILRDVRRLVLRLAAIMLVLEIASVARMDLRSCLVQLLRDGEGRLTLIHVPADTIGPAPKALTDAMKSAIGGLVVLISEIRPMIPQFF